MPSRRFSDQMDRHVEAVIEIMSLPQPRTYELIRLIQVQQSYSAALAQFTEPGLTYLLEEMGEAFRTAIEDALADLHEARAEMYLMHSQGDAT
ncbi:hypothetical protein ACFV29_12780 [Streptomyces sp. NPDC059690]|uniref:hypothetical protein n=1 Tax=Streptomyces sp. NPDC059690 TaxID=3346907 RepID=UPI0036C94166